MHRKRLLLSCLDLMKAAEITDVSQQPEWKDFTPNHYLLFGFLNTEAPQDSYLNSVKRFSYNAKANTNAKTDSKQ